MVDTTEFKDNRKPFLSIAEVINSKTRKAKITEEAHFKDFNSKQGGTFTKLIVPVSFEGKLFSLTLFPEEAKKLQTTYGYETRGWVDKEIELGVSGGSKPTVCITACISTATG